LTLGLAVVSSVILPDIYQSRKLENEANANEVLAMMKNSSRYLLEDHSSLTMQRFRLAPYDGAYPLLPFLSADSSGKIRYGGFRFQVIAEKLGWVATATPTLLNYSGNSTWRIEFFGEEFLATQVNPE